MKSARCSAVLALVVPLLGASAQELQPGLFWPLPQRLNAITVAYSSSQGAVSFDPALPVEQARATIGTAAVAFTRTLAVLGRTANVGIQVPLVKGHIDGLYAGEPTSVDRFGLADPRVQFGVNLYGAPAMTPRQFIAYTLRTIVAAGVTVVPPLGQYFEDKAVNLGTNRWSVKPELGISRGSGPWIVEMMAGVWLFSRNADFPVRQTRSQAPIGSGQFHLSYRFNRDVWLAGDANFYTGGRTTVGGVSNNDFQRNSRLGGTLSWTMTSHDALRLSASRSVYTNIGADFTTVSLAYTYAWLH